VEPISIENQNLIPMLQQSMVVLQSIKMCISFLVLGMDILQEKFWPIKWKESDRKIGLTDKEVHESAIFGHCARPSSLVNR
jgi:hypothetical protein